MLDLKAMVSNTAAGTALYAASRGDLAGQNEADNDGDDGHEGSVDSRALLVANTEL